MRRLLVLGAVLALGAVAVAAAAGGSGSRSGIAALAGGGSRQATGGATAARPHKTGPAGGPVKTRAGGGGTAGGRGIPGPAGVDAAVRAVAAVLRYTPFVVAGSQRRREVALTFDDGPGPLTPAILRVLTRLHVPATFFVVGQQLNDFAGALRQEVRDREAIGDHTENHAWLVRLPRGGQIGQIRDCALRLRGLGAGFPALLRPPYGALNGTTLAVARSLGMLVVLWSVETDDWQRPGAAVIVRRALAGARPGAIILLHDGGGPREQTLAALPAIIRGLRRRGLRLVTVPRLLADDPPPRHQRLPRFTGA